MAANTTRTDIVVQNRNRDRRNIHIKLPLTDLYGYCTYYIHWRTLTFYAFNIAKEILRKNTRLFQNKKNRARYNKRLSLSVWYV